jgi:hypothetical protein
MAAHHRAADEEGRLVADYFDVGLGADELFDARPRQRLRGKAAPGVARTTRYRAEGADAVQSLTKQMSA